MQPRRGAENAGRGSKDEDEGVGEADNEDEQLAKSSVASSFAFCT